METNQSIKKNNCLISNIDDEFLIDACARFLFFTGNFFRFKRELNVKLFNFKQKH